MAGGGVAQRRVRLIKQEVVAQMTRPSMMMWRICLGSSHAETARVGGSALWQSRASRQLQTSENSLEVGGKQTGKHSLVVFWKMNILVRFEDQVTYSACA